MNKKMMPTQKNKIVPELRFPEFVKDGEWKLTSIGEIGNFYYGKSAPKWSLSEEASTLCVRYGELYTKFDTIITEVKSRTNIEPSDLKFSKGGEILVPRVGERATDFAKNCCYLPYANIAIGEMISVFETKEFALFYTHYFRTLWREFAEVVEGQNVKNLYYINLEPIKIGKPSYEEQQKIADCLSSLDELITAHNDKLESLKNHKKGLLQNLFPQENQKIPNYRFPEFVNDGEWEEKKLERIGNPSMCKRIFKEETTNNENDIPFYKIGTFGKLPDSFIPKEIYEDYKKRFSFPKKGDILISASGTIGRLVVYDGEPAYFQDSNIVWIDNDENKVVNSFLFYSYTLLSWQTSDGGIIQRLYNSDLKNMQIVFPKNKIEQQKIADCLSVVDNLITAQTEKIEQLKAHKKGLMQGLFPKIEE